MKRLCSLVLVLAMVLSIGLPVLAQNPDPLPDEPGMSDELLDIEDEEEDDEEPLDQDEEGEQDDIDDLEPLDDEENEETSADSINADMDGVTINAIMHTPMLAADGDALGSFTYERPEFRTIINTDGEIDDVNSFVRALLYSNELNIAGIVYTSSSFQYAGNDAVAAEGWLGHLWVDYLIDRYEEVYDNLLVHDANYPEPDYLHSIVRVGNVSLKGEMDQDTEGSDLIKEILLDDIDDTVYLQCWGGANTVARALKSIQDEYENDPEWDDIYQQVCSKAVIFIILGQDDTYRDYISVEWPDIPVIYSSTQFGVYGYFWETMIPDEMKPYYRAEWFQEHVVQNHGPLLSEIMTWEDGHDLVNIGALGSDHKFGSDEHDDWGTSKDFGGPDAIANSFFSRGSELYPYDFISEGDTASFMYSVDLGLRSMENPSYGGWGGRFEERTPGSGVWYDVGDYNFYDNEDDDIYFPIARWVDAYQTDFAVRADWTITSSYSAANHRPEVVMRTPLDITAAPGATVIMMADATDPDGDALSYSWWQYREAGSYDGAVTLQAEEDIATFTVPAGASEGDTIHIVLEVEDDGAHNLVSYQRVIITVGDDGTYTDALAVLIEQAEGLNEVDYTADTWTVLTEALEAAKELAEDATQDEINEAFQELLDAIRTLEARTIRGKLNALVAQAVLIDSNAYTVDTHKAMRDALEEALQILAKDDADDDELQAAFDALIDAIEALELKTAPPPTTTSPSRRRSGGGNGSSNIRTPDTTPAFLGGGSTVATGPVDQASVVSEAAQKLQNASSADVVVKNATTVSAATMQALRGAAAAANGTVRLLADTMYAGGVQGRLYLHPSDYTLDSDIKLGVYVEGAEVERIKALFSQSYNNTFAAVCIEQGGFGMSVQVAAKLDLSGLNTSDLRFYRYNSGDGSYAAFLPDGVYIDVNGYLHFYVDAGGDIIITDGALTR